MGRENQRTMDGEDDIYIQMSDLSPKTSRNKSEADAKYGNDISGYEGNDTNVGIDTSTTQAQGIIGNLYSFYQNRDFLNIILLVVLYWLQGIPLGLAMGSIPFLLKEKLSYAEIATFTLAGYPYSVKLLWSPIVDCLYNAKIGRRKSWIIPIQFTMALLFLTFGSQVGQLMQNPAENIGSITAFFLTVVIFSATQDIAVDGWALTLLSKENLSYASTCQTVGLNCGFFLSFTAFLALNSVEFSNKYIWSTPQNYGLLQLGPYLKFWAVIYILVTVYLFLFKNEGNDSEEEDLGIVGTYKTIWKICKLSHMRELILVLMVCKIGFIPDDSVTQLKLIEKGMHKEDMALAVLIDFPVQIIFGYYAARWSRGKNAITPWRLAFMVRICFSFLSMLNVYWFPKTGMTTPFFYLILFTKIVGSMASTVQFVGMSAFFTQIADPAIGGTYMTLVNTLSNLGGTLPVYFVLESVDWFTNATCSVPNEQNQAFSCLKEPEKALCGSLGGECNTERDGYFVVSLTCLTVAIVLFYTFIKPTVIKLESLPSHVWRLSKEAKH